MPDERPKLTSQEQAALTQLEAICKSDKVSKRYITDCALLKQTKIAEYDQKQANAKAIANQILNQRKLEAFGYVTSKMFNILVEGQLLSNALQKASGEYDQIVAAKASEPIWKEIAFTLFLTALPELKIVGRAVGSFIPKRDLNYFVSKASDAGDWEKLADDVLGKIQKSDNINAGIQTFGSYLDNQSKDIIEAIKNPLNAGSDFDAETQKRLAGFNAKNEVLTTIIKSIEKRLVISSRLLLLLYHFIVWYQGPDVLDFITSLMKDLGFDTEMSYSGKEFDLFADLILYDMLRAYAKQYCKVSVEEGSGIEHWHEIEGLNQASRGLIYKKFGIDSWNKPILNYPSVNNSKELVAYWGITIQTYTERSYPTEYGGA